MITANLQLAQQRVVDARAALLELGSQRIEIESRAARHESERLAHKADPKAYRTAINRLRECGEDLDRVALLVGEAEGALEDALAAERKATFEVDAAKFDADVAVIEALAASFCAAYGQQLAALRKLRAVLDAAEVARGCLDAQARAAGATMRRHDSVVHAAELAKALKPKVDVAFAPLRCPAHTSVIVSALRSELGQPPPKPETNYHVVTQINDLVEGSYAARLKSMETGGERAA